MEDHVSSNADTGVHIKTENDAPFGFTVTTLYPKEISDISYSSLLKTELKEELSETSSSNITMHKNDDDNEVLYLKDNGKNICRNVGSKKSVNDLSIDKVFYTPKRQVLDSRLKPAPMTLVANLHNKTKLNRAAHSSKQHAVAPLLIAPKEPLLFQQPKELLHKNIEINSSISTLQTSTPFNEPLVNINRAQNLMIETPVRVGNQTFLIKFDAQVLFTPTTVTSYSISTSAPTIAVSNSISTFAPTTVVSSHSMSIFSPKIANASSSLASVCTPSSLSQPTNASRVQHGWNCADVPKIQIQSNASKSAGVRKSARVRKSIKNSNSLKPHETNNPTSYVGTGQPASHQCSPVMKYVKLPHNTCQLSPKQFLIKPSFPQQTFPEMNLIDQNVSNESTDKYFLSKFTLKQGQLRKKKISATYFHSDTHVATSSSSVFSSNNTSTTGSGICNYSTPVSNTKTLDSTTLHSPHSSTQQPSEMDLSTLLPTLHSPKKQLSHNNPPMSILSSQTIGHLNMKSNLKGVEQLKPQRLTFHGDISLLKKALVPCVVRLEKLNDSSLLQEYLLNKKTEKAVKLSNKLTKVNEPNKSTELNEVCSPLEGKGEISMKDKLLDNKDCPSDSDVRNSKLLDNKDCPSDSGVRNSKLLDNKDCACPSESDVRNSKLLDNKDCPSDSDVRNSKLLDNKDCPSDSGVRNSKLLDNKDCPSDSGVRNSKLFDNKDCPSDSGVRNSKLLDNKDCPSDSGVRHSKLLDNKDCPSDSGVRNSKLLDNKDCPSDSGVRNSKLFDNKDCACPSDSDVRNSKLLDNKDCPSDSDVRNSKLFDNKDCDCPSDSGVRNSKLLDNKDCPSDSGVRNSKLFDNKDCACPSDSDVRNSKLLDNKDCPCPSDSGVRNSVLSCTGGESFRITSGSHTMSNCLLQEECHYSSESDSDVFDGTDCNSTPALKTQFLKKHRHTTVFLIKHSEMFSVGDDQESYKCNVCKCYKTNGLFRLQKHLKKHIDGFLCSNCGLEAGSEHDLAEHRQHCH